MTDAATGILGLGVRWSAVLDDAEALLAGEKLLPHPFMRTDAGINLRRLLQNPAPVDIAEWFHGAGLVPYAEAGNRVDSTSIDAFGALARGQALFFMFFVD